MITLKKLLNIAAIMLTTTALAQSNYAPPRTASGKPNLQGFWTNASLTTMQRSDNYKDIGLVIPADRLQELTTNHHQNVGRQLTTIRWLDSYPMVKTSVEDGAITHSG